MAKCDGMLIWSDTPEMSKAFGTMVYPYHCPKCGIKGRATSKYQKICNYESAQQSMHLTRRRRGQGRTKTSAARR